MNATKMACCVTVALFAACLATKAQQQVSFEPTWESLQQYRAPKWYQDAKFGIFLHWGVYAVPAYGTEWYPRRMYQEYKTDSGGKSTGVPEPTFQWHREHFGLQSKFGYKDFIPLFKAEKWNPDEWAELFEKAGAKYVVPVAEHHDGFAMYASTHTKWNAAAMGPHRDVLGELAKAVRKRGMKLGASSHYAFNWRYYTCADHFDTCDPEYGDLYGYAGGHAQDAPASRKFLDHWYASTQEIIDKYQPDLLWFDFGFEQPEFEPYRKRIAAYYYNQARAWGREVVLNYKHHAYPDGAAVLDIERGKLNEIRDMVWQTDTSVGRKSWGYIEGEEFKSAGSIIDELVDIVSKNGCLLLNVGPRADGTIPEPAQQILLDIGKWLAVNGEAIYGTRPWKIYGEGPTQEEAEGSFSERKGAVSFTAQDIRFTTKAGVLYAICLGWPGKKLLIKSLAPGAMLEPREIFSVRLLGSSQALKWDRGKEGLAIELPRSKPGDYAYAFKIMFR